MNDKSALFIEIRRLWKSDLEEYYSHLLRLDLRSRRFRFAGGTSDEAVRTYAEGCFGPGDLIYGAFVNNALVGVAELRSPANIWFSGSHNNKHIRAEVAFSVELEYQRCGIGEKLFNRIQQAASNHGVETIELMCLAENIGMRNLARKFKAYLRFEDSVLTGNITAKHPTVFSILHESFTDIIDYNLSIFDMYWKNTELSRTN